MPQQAVTIEILPQAFEGVKEMQAGGLDRGEGCRPSVARRLPGSSRVGIIEGRMAEAVDRRRDGLRNDLDDLLACFRCRTLAERRQVRTTNAGERRFREVLRRTRPTGTFRDRTSMDRIIHAVFIHEDMSRGISTPVSLTHDS